MNMNTFKGGLSAIGMAATFVSFAATEVAPPDLGTSPYNGSVQVAAVPASPLWTLVFSESGEHAGSYDSFLRLVDPVNYAWTGTSEAMIAAPFAITKADNEWTTAPSITGWTFGDVPHEPVAVARFGAVKPVVYSGTTAAGVAVSEAAAVSEAGSYTAAFDVAGTDDYTALHREVAFTIARKSAAGADLVVTVGENPKYDGAEKTLAVTAVTCGGNAIPYTVTGNKATNAGTYTLTVTAGGNYTGAKTVAWKILPRDIAHATIGAIADQVETGSAICPALAVSDGNPSIITADDYTISYANNVNPGTATVAITGKRNYAGAKQVVFTITPRPVEKAMLSAEASWKFLKASGTYCAQVKVKCVSGYAAGISNLRLGFADRSSGSTTLAQLWNTPARSAVAATATVSDVTYRVVPLAADAITAENVVATYGVASLSASTIPVSERVVELYVPKRDLPAHLADYTAGIIWESRGTTYTAPVVNVSAQ